MAKRTPPPVLYNPQPNELVRDEKHNLTGHYMGPGYGKHPTVYLRPPGGGCEWETPASEIQPLTTQGPDLRPALAQMHTLHAHITAATKRAGTKTTGHQGS